MVELHFQKYLSAESIENIRQEHEFRNALPLEKFMMDYEVLIHIQEVLPDCVVKGGMAVPFHLRDDILRRLSTDIDIVTGKSRDEVIEDMKKVSEKLKEIVSINEPHIPKGEKKKELPLLTYYCEYKSSIDENPEMKIEIFYGNKMEIKSKLIDTETEIMGFSVDFPISIYDHGALIGDKLTTLPFNTIGIDPEREIDVPKQIYDIANLMKSCVGEFPINEIIESFEKIANDEIGYFVKERPSFDAVMTDLDSFSDGLLVTDNQIKLNKSYNGRFDEFVNELLGKTRYPPHAHVTDMLLIKILVKLILKKFEGKLDTNTIAEKIKEIIEFLKTIPDWDAKDKTRLIRQMKGKYKNDETGELIKNFPAEHAYLYDQILEINRI